MALDVSPLLQSRFPSSWGRPREGLTAVGLSQSRTSRRALSRRPAMKIDIEPAGDVDVVVTFRYVTVNAPRLSEQYTTLEFWPENVTIQVLNGDVAQIVVTGHQALKDDRVGERIMKRVFIREDFPDLPLWLRNVSQVAAINVGVAGLVP